MMRRTRWFRPVGQLVAIIAGAALVAGCGGPTFSSLPLPGSGVSGSTIQVSATFAEALNLAQGAAVRINGVDSGRVQDVTTKDFRAVVTMKIRKNAKLRQDATARLRYTTPLGELFVDVTNPAAGSLVTDGGSFGLKQTSTAPTVEDALSSASLLINGGGLNQLQTITTEANKALGGHEHALRDLLAKGSNLLTQINGSSAQIDHALRSLDSASRVLQQRKAIIHKALIDVRPAAATLRANTANLTALLTSLNRFAGTANTTVNATRAQIITLIHDAGPVLQEMVSVRPVFPATLKALLHLRTILTRVIPGDYLNLGTHLEIDKVAAGGSVLGLNTLLDQLGLGGLTGSGSSAGGGLLGLSNIGKNTANGVTSGLISGLLGGSKSSKSGSGPSAADTGILGTLLGGLLGGGK